MMFNYRLYKFTGFFMNVDPIFPSTFSEFNNRKITQTKIRHTVFRWTLIWISLIEREMKFEAIHQKNKIVTWNQMKLKVRRNLGNSLFFQINDKMKWLLKLFRIVNEERMLLNWQRNMITRLFSDTLIWRVLFLKQVFSH